MRQKKSRLICCILVFIMTFTGMCMDNKHADSFLENSTLGNQTCAYILAKDSTITSEAVCTQRMLGISEMTFINHVTEYRNVRAKMRSSLTPVIIKLSSRRFTCLHMAEEDMSFTKPCLKAIILNYIHKQDGEK